MTSLEFAISERNRLVWLSIVTTVFAFASTLAALDPFLNVNLPFTGTQVGNITAGHIVLFGHPILCLIVLILCAQIQRYHRILTAIEISDSEKYHLDWRQRISSSQTTWERRSQRIVESFRWFALLGLPALATVVLFCQQFHFYYCPLGEFSEADEWFIVDSRHYCDGKWEKITVYEMFGDESALGEESASMIVAYSKLRRLQCALPNINDAPSPDFVLYYNKIKRLSACPEQEEFRRKLLARLPRPSQPLNFLVMSFFQICVLIVIPILSFKYFKTQEKTPETPTMDPR